MSVKENDLSAWTGGLEVVFGVYLSVFFVAMAEDLKKVANDLVDDVLNGVSNEFGKSATKGNAGNSFDRSLLCILLSPSTYFSYILISLRKFIVNHVFVFQQCWKKGTFLYVIFFPHLWDILNITSNNLSSCDENKLHFPFSVSYIYFVFFFYSSTL